jgi:uncharacterized protein YjeT (DUF2065 family)
VGELLVAIGLVLVIEGILYAAFPSGMKSAVAQVFMLPDQVLRIAGLAAAVAGLVAIWFVRG